MPNNPEINNQANSDNEIRNRFFELTTKAAIAQDSGDELSAVNLYLAAYEIAKKGSQDIIKSSVVGVKKSWEIVLRLKNRPLAEYIFEILSQNCNETELEKFSEELHNLMLDKLKGLGVPIEHLQDTNSANDALNKMKDFISDMNNEAPEAKIDDSKKVNNREKPKSEKQAENDTYYIKRELNKFNNLVGYESAIQIVKQKGIVGKKNTQYMQLVERLNKEHGLNRISFSKTLIFRSSSNVDGNIFMEATASEIGMPCIQMHMDENIQGTSVLCMMAPADSNFRLNPGRTGFNGKGILMLEDVDSWDFPEPPEVGDESIASFMNAQMSRGIAEVTNLIDVALEDPNILVMASVSDKIGDDDIRKALGSDMFTVIDINNPNDRERAEIWNKLAADHPSLRAFSIQKLVNYSKNMSRYDIEVAVHEALEDAYRLGIQKGEYIPLSIVNIVEKLADHQPLDSTEYKTLEDVATEDFKKDLENIDDMLK